MRLFEFSVSSKDIPAYSEVRFKDAGELLTKLNLD
jgi:hypothetical protein